jgi:hypothetical protein
MVAVIRVCFLTDYPITQRTSAALGDTNGVSPIFQAIGGNPDARQWCMGSIPTAQNHCLSSNQPAGCFMKQDSIEAGRFSDQGKGLGTVTPEMVRRRARQIAVINGREENQVLDSDFEQALRELQGEERLNPVPSAEERLPESKRWDPVGGSEGRKAPTMQAADEQTFAEKLVEEGVADAEQNQALEGAQESRRRDESP